MYVRITAGKFFVETNAGQPAAGYEIHTYAAGSSTPAVSYSNRQLSVANANPVVLNSRGEADIFTGVPLKLIFTIPSGDPSSPIWSEDYIGEQQSNNLEGDGVSIGHNNYTVAITPAPLALTNRLQLIMTPNTTNVDTMGSTVFTGSGINDAVFTGPYTGSTSGAVFQAKIDNTTLNPPVAPTAVLSATAGIVTAGHHLVKLVAVNSTGVSLPGSASGDVNADGTHKIDLTGIPAIAGDITGYKIYMTKAGGTTYYYVDITTSTTYSINVADASLTVVAPTANTSYDTFTWRIDAGAWTAGVTITGNNVKQILANAVAIAWAEPAGHTYGDLWTVTVETPVRINLDSLGNELVYKNKGGNLVALEAGDLQSGIAATLVYNTGATAWILNNPSTAAGGIITSTTNRVRKELTTDYNLLAADQGSELSFTTPANGNLTLTMLAASVFSNQFIDFKNIGTGTLTIDAGASYIIKGIGTRYLVVGPGSGGRIITNGVDWHVLFNTGGLLLVGQKSVSAGGAVGSPVQFTGLIPGQRYLLVYELTQNTAGTARLLMTFNSDSVANYNHTQAYTGGGANVTVGDTSILLSYMNAGGDFLGQIEFTTISNAKKVVGNSTGFTDVGGLAGSVTFFQYSGAANMSTCEFVTSAGTLTGKFRLYLYS